MKLAILKVILWAKDLSKEPRVIEFKPGMINIISGQSATGKSTISKIIDYALGSDKCAIPIGEIRRVTEWFGLHLQLEYTEMIVARKNPGDQQGTSDLFWDEGPKLEVPPVVRRNARVEDLKNRFNQLALLPALPVFEEFAGFGGGRPSFRDMAAFNFQPQHIVANPYTLFFKADTTEHREKLKNVFPLALGSISADDLLKQRELRELERELERLRRDYEVRSRASKAWETDVQSYYLQAMAQGLLPKDDGNRAGWSMGEYVKALRTVPQKVNELDLPDFPEGSTQASVSELTRLINEEDELGNSMSSNRRRLDKLDQLVSSLNSYQQGLATQADRMAGVGWFEKAVGATSQCPVCKADHKGGSKELRELQALGAQFSALATSVNEAPASLDEELATARDELRRMEESISSTRHKRHALEQQAREMSEQRSHIRQIYLLVGRIQQALENVKSSQPDSELVAKGKELAKRVDDLRAELDPVAQRNRLQAANRRVGTDIESVAKELQLEHATENVSINTKELTLQFNPPESGRTDFLWEVGSGQNWVGYHIATMIALHKYFLHLPSTPVPQFLVIDQPSQVYFPDESWPSLEDGPEGEHESDPQSADIAGVRRIFKVLSDFMAGAAPNFQIIVTEHAGSIAWKGYPYVHLAGNWRDGHDEFLIPADWLSAPSA